MLKNHWKLIAQIERIIDNIFIVLAFFCAYQTRETILSFAGQVGILTSDMFPELGSIDQYLPVLAISLPLANALLSMLGAYRSMRFTTFFSLARLMIVVGGALFLGLSASFYTLKLDLSRSFVVVFCFFVGLLLFVERFFVLRFLRYLRANGRNYRNILVVGTGEPARKLYLELVKHAELGLKVVGFVSLDGAGEKVKLLTGNCSSCAESGNSSSAVYDLSARIVADRHSFEGALKRHAVDEVLFSDVTSDFRAVEDLAEIAVDEGVRVTLAADLFSLNFRYSDVGYLGTVPLIHYHTSPVESWPLIAKRLTDIALSSVVLLAITPLLIAVSVAIKFSSPGPVLFKQKRVGLNGRTFTLLKFRSMVENAEKMLPDLRAFNEMEGPAFKLRNDPRVTRIGRLMRRFSVDELPQLLNVLRGDMSLVGPRPPLPEEVHLYRRKHRRRLSMRPGITCTWQVSGRNDIPDFNKWAELDLQYIDNWSLLSDFRLLVRTIPAVFFGSGAR